MKNDYLEFLLIEHWKKYIGLVLIFMEHTSKLFYLNHVL